MERVLIGRPVVAFPSVGPKGVPLSGRAKGTALVSNEPLSFWGGLSPNTGEIIDRRHPRSGAIVTDRVFVFPKGKGSSTASGILLESIRAGTAPAAVINLKTDPILALGAIVADELYHRSLPILTLKEDDFYSIKEGDYLVIESNGTVRVNTSQGGEK